MKKILLPLLLCVSSFSFANGILYANHSERTPQKIYTATGIASEIKFREDEDIIYATFGFTDAWDSQIISSEENNDNGAIFIFKNILENANTNLLIHTNKGDYVFLVEEKMPNWKKAELSGATFSYRIKDSAKEVALKNKNQQHDNEFRNSHITYDKRGTGANTLYFYSADKNSLNLVPKNVWDNGKLTFFTFKQNAPRGSLYVYDDGKERIVNSNTDENGVLIVQGVYNKLVLRKGDQVVVIENRNNQNIEDKKDNPNEYSSALNGFKRVIKNEK